MLTLTFDQLHPHRVYFTELDRGTYAQVAWNSGELNAFTQQLERKLKALTLVKGHVVIAASHLFESELGRELILANPDLISRAVVVPALRADSSSCKDFLARKRMDVSEEEARLYVGSEQDEMADFLDSHAQVVCWRPADTANWFQQRLLSDVDDDGSLLRSILRERGGQLSSEFQRQLTELERPSRNDIYSLAKQFGNNRAWRVLCAYIDFLYYLSGARAVQSEGLLPQENVLDFGLSEMAGRRTSLSDTQIFFKLFCSVVKSVTAAHLPIDLLDVLTFDDAIALHEIAVREHFVDQYHRIQEKTKEGLTIRDPERLILLMQELEQYETDLAGAYETELRRELPARFRKRKRGEIGQVLQSTASLFIDPYGMADGVKSLVVSSLRLIGQRRLADGLESMARGAFSVTQHLLESGSGAGQSVMLEYLEAIFARYADRARGNLGGVWRA